MAGGITNGKKDGLVLCPSLLKGFLTPRVPVHRIIGVLEEVGTDLVYQSIESLILVFFALLGFNPDRQFNRLLLVRLIHKLNVLLWGKETFFSL